MSSFHSSCDKPTVWPVRPARASFLRSQRAQLRQFVVDFRRAHARNVNASGHACQVKIPLLWAGPERILNHGPVLRSSANGDHWQRVDTAEGGWTRISKRTLTRISRIQTRRI